MTASVNSTTSSNYFLSLPDEVKLLILSSLRINDLFRLALVSKECNRLSQSNTLWRHRIIEDFPQLKLVHDLSYKQQYSEVHQIILSIIPFGLFQQCTKAERLVNRNSLSFMLHFPKNLQITNLQIIQDNFPYLFNPGPSIQSATLIVDSPIEIHLNPISMNTKNSKLLLHKRSSVFDPQPTNSYPIEDKMKERLFSVIDVVALKSQNAS